MASADRRQSEAVTRLGWMIANSAGTALLFIAMGILFFGVITEIFAVVALYQQRISAAAGSIVVSETIFMIIAAAAPPAIVFGRYIRQMLTASREYRLRLMRAGIPGRHQEPEARARDVTGTGPPGPGPVTPPETGKTGAEG